MSNTFQNALENTNLTNEQILSMATDIAKTYTSEVDSIVLHVSECVNELDNNALRAVISDLSLKAYSLGEAKEFSSLKADCADMLMKEVQATEFNSGEGTVEARRNASLLNSENEQLVKVLYNTVTSLLKVKLDECHRIVDTLKTVIMTRNTEAKINQGITDIREGM